MVRSLTPSNEKLVSKGIASVRERVINLREITPLSQVSFFQQLIDYLCDSHYYLTDEDEHVVLQLESKFLDPQWIYDHNPPYDAIFSGRTPKAGKIELRFSIRHNRIESCQVSGDFFALNIIDQWESYFRGIPYTTEAIQKVLEQYPINHWIQNATNEDIIQIMKGVQS